MIQYTLGLTPCRTQIDLLIRMLTPRSELGQISTRWFVEEIACFAAMLPELYGGRLANKQRNTGNTGRSLRNKVYMINSSSLGGRTVRTVKCSLAHTRGIEVVSLFYWISSVDRSEPASGSKAITSVREK
ncbi:hypothetical protein TNCV_2920051 [Trichonephila clavipes]|nr:hypothetical protein TNCV_2920051 [Trichonephila clavipes]